MLCTLDSCRKPEVRILTDSFDASKPAGSHETELVGSDRKGDFYMSEQRTMRSFEELRYRDDFMFGKVMEEPILSGTDRYRFYE